VGKVSIYPEKVQTNIYILAFVRDCFWHTDYTFIYCLPYAGKPGDIKMLGQGGLESCLP
jgi:hypothetical protein